MRSDTLIAVPFHFPGPLQTPSIRAPPQRLGSPGRVEDVPGQGVGLDIDHDDMAAIFDGPKRKANTGCGTSGGINNDFKPVCGDQGIGILGDPGSAIAVSRCAVLCRELII